MNLVSRIETLCENAYLYERDEKCWKEVISEPTGLEIIRAAVIFRAKKLVPPVPKSAITFSCGRQIEIDPEYRVALKRDSPFFASLFFEKDIVLSHATLEQFEHLLKVLYENAKFDEIDYLKIANYFDIPCLFHKAINRLKARIEKCSVDEAIALHDALTKETFPFYTELLEELAKKFESFDLSQALKIRVLHLTKNIEIDFSKFSNLTSLRIAHPDIDENNLVFSPSLKHLSLTLSRKIEDATIHRFTNLKSLMLGATRITDQGLTSLSFHLTALNVGGCESITDRGLLHVPLTLRDLNVANTQITIESILRLTALTRINIADCAIRGTNLSRLTVVELSTSKLNEEELPYLPRCLRKLFVNFCNLESLKGLPRLYDFRIRSSSLIDSSLLYLYRGLTYLDLSLHIFITAEGIKLIPRTVRYLFLWRCSKIDDAAIKALPKRLLQLDVSGCKLITNEGIKSLPRSLTELDIDGCSEITDEAIPYFPVNLSRIHHARTKITKTL